MAVSKKSTINNDKQPVVENKELPKEVTVAESLPVVESTVEIKSEAVSIPVRMKPEAKATYYFGVDSVTPAMNNVGNGESLYDYVVRVAGRRPSFWGRYLGNYAITPDEVQFLHSKGCAILLMYNWTNSAIVSQGYATGVSQAHIAINMAQAIGAPQGTVIGFDDERGWNLNPDFVGGWSDTLRNSNYYGAGMAYGNPQDSLFTNAYNNAFATYKSMSEEPVSLVWSCEPEFGATFPVPEWAPYYPSSNAEGTTFWQYAIDYNNLIDLDLCSQVGFDSLWKAIIKVRALHTCALKPDTSHESKSIHTIFGGDILIQNYEEYIYNKNTNQREMWLNVTAVDKNGKVIVDKNNKAIIGFVPQKETTLLGGN